MEVKQCSKCKEVKSVTEFVKDKRAKSGLASHCKTCAKKYREENKEYLKQWHEENKEKRKEYKKQYYEENKEKINQQSKQYREENKDKKKEYLKQWRKENKEKIKEYDKQYREKNKEYYKNYGKKWKKNKRKTDPIFKFKHNVRILISGSFKRCKNNYTKKLSSEQILGCDIDFFRKYIESKFTKGMTFDNHGEWHLDHIIPLATAETEDDVIRLNHYTNFQPLWAEDNISKGGRINEPTQIVLRL